MAGTAERMSGVGIGGLVELAMALASGFILCAWEPWRGYLRRQPPPIPYFTFLAVGVIWWVTVTPLISVLGWICGWSNICFPTFGEMLGFADNQRHEVNALFLALIIWIILLFYADKAWGRILKCRVKGQTIEWRISERSLRHLRGGEIEKMVNEAVRNRIMIMLTLSNRKIYIGHPNQVTRDESGRERWISIVPYRSGFRCQNTGKLTLTTIYDGMLQGETSYGSSTIFDMCIPIREVVSFQYFDPVLYERFQSESDRGAVESAMGDNEERRGEESGQSAEEERSADFVDTDGKHKRETNRQ